MYHISHKKKYNLKNILVPFLWIWEGKKSVNALKSGWFESKQCEKDVSMVDIIKVNNNCKKKIMFIVNYFWRLFLSTDKLWLKLNT